MTLDLDKSSKISIGLMLALISMLIPVLVVFWSTKLEVRDQASDSRSREMVFSNQVEKLNQKLDAVLADIEAGKDERYRMTNASENALRMALENPGLRVPDPRNPGAVIVMRGSAVRAGWGAYRDPLLGGLGEEEGGGG